MGTKTFSFLSVVALAVSACGPRTGPSDTVPNPENAGGGSTTVYGIANPTSGSASAGASNCPQYPSRGYYEYYVTGSGQASRDTKSNDIVADHKLRVSIEPKASGANPNPKVGGSSGYGKMAVTVTLLKNGKPIASQTIPNPSTYDEPLNDRTSGYALSVKTDAKSDPAMADFSGVLSGSGRYSIRVSGVKTNTVCKSSCKANAPGMSYCTLVTQGGGGGVLTTEYGTGFLYACSDTNLKECNRLNCGVGPSLNSETWSLNVRVETDNTTCILK